MSFVGFRARVPLMKRLVLILIAALAVSCSGGAGSPTTPTPTATPALTAAPTPTPTPAPTPEPTPTPTPTPAPIPTPTPTPTPTPLTPSISSIAPLSPTASASNQTVTVSGSNFQGGLTVTIVLPSGLSSTLGGSQIQSVTSTSFQMSITLADAGNYALRANNPDAQQSNTVGFTVTSSQPPPPLPLTPSISSISPVTPFASPIQQTVAVSGTNFQAGLTVSVRPRAGSMLSGIQIQNVTSTSFQMIITLADAIDYTLLVINPGGLESNAFGFGAILLALPPPPSPLTPSISSISPSSPTASASIQTVTVNGSSFQAGLTVTVGLPGGGSSTLSGGTIQSVTLASFQMIILLADAGNYTLRVTNPAGLQSNVFAFSVTPPSPLTPSISAISPAVPTSSIFSQTVTVNGANFQAGTGLPGLPGLTVTVFSPGGDSSTLSGSQIQSVTSRSFEMRITLVAAGTYRIRVTNPSGQPSNTFGFTVR